MSDFQIIIVVVGLMCGAVLFWIGLTARPKAVDASPPPRCSHCHLTISNASARYCPRCGADKQSSGAEVREDCDMWRGLAIENMELLKKSADLASAAVRQLPETVYIYPSADFSTIDHCK